MHISPTPQDFLDQSLLLIQARPTTTRITTTYSTSSPSLRLSKRRSYLAQKTKIPTDPQPTPTTTSPATLTLKTFDPVSGAIVKFSTHKVSDVGRLMGVLGRAARGMGGLPALPPPQQDTVMPDAPPGIAVAKVLAAGGDIPRGGSPAPSTTSVPPGRVGTPGGEKQQGGAAGGAGGAGGKGKKKKGKK